MDNMTYCIEADTLDEAIDILSDPDRIYLSEIITYMLKNNKRDIKVEYGNYTYYNEYSDSLFNTKGIETITDKDLQIDWFDIAVDLYRDKQEASKKMEDCLKNIIAMKEDEFKGY